MEKDIAKIVISEDQIRNKLLELSKTLISDYTGKEWTIIAILNGSLVFLADLIRLIPFSYQTGYYRCRYVRRVYFSNDRN